MAFCNLCNCHIRDDEAVPYADVRGQPIERNGKIEYRNWCLTHWSLRRGALPPSHPMFLAPLDARTRTKDKRALGLTEVNKPVITIADIPKHDPSPAPKIEEPPIREPIAEEEHIPTPEWTHAQMNQWEAKQKLLDFVAPHTNPTDLLKRIQQNTKPRIRIGFPAFYPDIMPKVDIWDIMGYAVMQTVDATIVSKLENKGFSTNKIAHYLKTLGYPTGRIASALDKGFVYIAQLLRAPAPNLQDIHDLMDGKLPSPVPSPEPTHKIEHPRDHIYTVNEILKGYAK